MTRLRRRAGFGPAVAPLALLALVVLPVLAVGTAPAATPSSSPAPPAIAVASASAASAASAPASAAPATSPPPAATPPPSGAGSDSGSGSGSTSAPRPHLGLDAANDRRPIAGAMSALVPGSVDRSSLALTAEYDVSLDLDFGTRAFAAETTILVRNDSGAGIDRLELNTVATRLGRATLGAVSVAGRAVAASISDQTIVVPLGGILPVGRSVVVTVAFTAMLRSDLAGSNWLFTRTSGIVDAYRWIPWVSRRTPFDRPNHGDPFVTPVSPRVRVAIDADRPLVFATTGEQVAASGTSRTFEATNVRDFVFTAAPDYRSISTKTADGQTTVRVYYRPGFAAQAVLAAAKSAIEKMEPLVGAYPYPTYDLAQTAGGYGMEAPGLTWIPTGAGNLTYLVTHETAHQWFYGIVGGDQAAEPFTDEAAADFLARHVLGSRRGSSCSTARLDRAIYDYSSACYYEVIYIQGGNFLDDLRRAMGSTAFWTGVRSWIAASRWEIASTKSLLDALDAATTLNLVPRYEPRFPRLY